MSATPQTGNLKSQDWAKGPDRWAFKPALICVLVVAALELVCQMPGLVSFFLIPVLVIACLITPVIILGAAIYGFVKRRPRSATSVLLMLALPVSLWKPISWVTAVIHLGLTVGLGIGQFGAPSKSQDGNFAVYDWSVGLSISPSILLIHDATDEIALPMAQHSHLPSSENGFGEECAGKSEHLISHYYVCVI